MKYFLVAGEPSGDLHGSSLIEEIKKIDKQAEFQYFGGDLMRNATESRPIKHVSELAVMGFWAVLKKLPTIFKNLKLCKEAILKFKPDAVILIDYPGFNLKIAKFVKKHTKASVHYYISPTVWAWKSGRVKQIKRDVDQMLSIIPFEKEFYAQYDYEVQYVGNPVVDFIEAKLDKTESIAYFRKKHFILNEKPIIALLPGSREQEIASSLPKMIEVVKKFPNYQVIISGVNSVATEFYYEYLNGNQYPVLKHHPYQLLFHADLAIVNSGTATLETALIRTPQIVVYHVMFGRLAYLLKHLFIKTKYIALVNILAGKEVVKELYAHKFTTKKLYEEANRILTNNRYRETMVESYDKLIADLGAAGSPQRAAKLIYDYAKNNS